MKKLLVIMPLYNRGKYLEYAIESVVQQTYKNWELVIIDDCSTDNSLEIAKQYSHLDNVTILENDTNKGCYYSRNRGLDYFKDKEWDYFTIHDPDDVSDITRFEEILKEFNSEILGIRTLYVEVDKDLNTKLINGKSTFHSEGIAFFKREVFENILGYYDNTRFSGDTDYWWRLEAYCKINGINGTHLSDKPLYLRRHHGENLSVVYDWEVTRPKYWNKVRNDINKMVNVRNFYREIFK
jgi:glycosyltransferase involved in cell wall biosynthesis